VKRKGTVREDDEKNEKSEGEERAVSCRADEHDEAHHAQENERSDGYGAHD
jgi:hypothetical protein